MPTRVSTNGGAFGAQPAGNSQGIRRRSRHTPCAVHSNAGVTALQALALMICVETQACARLRRFLAWAVEFGPLRGRMHDRIDAGCRWLVGTRIDRLTLTNFITRERDDYIAVSAAQAPRPASSRLRVRVMLCRRENRACRRRERRRLKVERRDCDAAASRRRLVTEPRKSKPASRLRLGN